MNHSYFIFSDIVTNEVSAPVKVGDEVGNLNVYEDGNFMYSVPLTVMNDINKANIFTVWVFLLNGLVCGVVSASLITPLQESVKEEYQTSVVSIASTGARLFYIPLVYLINYLGNIKLQLAFVGMLIIFTPISLIIYKKLKKCEKI